MVEFRRSLYIAVILALVLGPSSGALSPAENPDGAGGETPPGAAPLSAELAARLWSAYEAQEAEYTPRTEHLRADGTPVYVNRLILESSPYLLQHAHNPVDWYPWGPEAFEAARRDGKPIFLSIGYSTCHWCHVMERGSFDDEETARLMNQWFVSIKVDREQRPDVDQVYMTAVQLITGQGGWPMSSLLTSDGKPFFGGTYFPQDSFRELLRKVADAWRDQRPLLVRQAEEVADRVALFSATSGEVVDVGSGVVTEAVRQSLGRHDDSRGGFSPAPKFPHESELLFLLERASRSGDRETLRAVELTLDRMARGGIHDQIGGGFHRYSTDSEWLVPHFEKMLYNQAHLARAYLEAARITGNGFFERVARQSLDYVLRDMTSPAGAFFSATDADSEGREGEFFVWTPRQIREALPAADADLAIRVFGVTDRGNFEGKNILHLPATLSEAAGASEMPLSDLLARLDRIRERLYEAREQRVHPLRDEKIVTAWNAMMITSLARAGDALRDERYLEAARRAAEFLWQNNRRRGGRLWRAHLAGTSSVEASQNDYAYLLEALVTLYDVTGESSYLERAAGIADAMDSHFWDDVGGGFFMSEDDHGGRLPVRPKSLGDGAIPSGNSVAVRALAMLSARTGRLSYRQKAESTVAAFSKSIRRQPTGFAYLLLGVDELLHGAVGALEYGAGGVVRVAASWDAVRSSGASSSYSLAVRLEIADGWHVNSNRPLQDHLVPTRLIATGDGLKLEDIDYPAAEVVTLGFQDEPLSVFQGSFEISAGLETLGTGELGRAGESGGVRVELTLQACDDERCLRPETLALELPVPGRR
ncbi:MAG: DUF255 domain-containing protein [bacterium]|nr:DUF255 domain-containing protein [bacterium]